MLAFPSHTEFAGGNPCERAAIGARARSAMHYRHKDAGSAFRGRSNALVGANVDETCPAESGSSGFKAIGSHRVAVRGCGRDGGR